MPSEKKRQSLLEDKERLEKALDLHDVKIKKPLEQFREYFRGMQWNIEGRANYTDEIVDNIVYGIVSSFVASMYLGNPKISVTPKTSTVVVNGKQMEASLGAMRHQVLSDFLYEELDINSTMELVTVDAFLGHRGIVFTGFEAKTESIDANISKELTNDIEDIPEESNLLFNEIIESESLFVERISPMDFITEVDATDPNLKDSKRIYIRWVKTVQEVKDEYGKDVEANGEIEHSDNRHQFSAFRRGDSITPEKDIWGRVEGYTIWDKDNQEVRTVVIDHDEYLKTESWPIDYKGDFPVDVLWFNYMPDSAIPIADTELYKGRQDYINIIHSKIVDHIRKLADRKYAYDKRIKKHDFENWAKGPSGSGLPVSNPKNAIDPMNDGGVSQDLYVGVTSTKSDVFGMLGISQFETGGQTDFNSATEGKLEARGVLPKRAFRSAKYKKFITRVIAKLANVASQVLPTTEIPLGENTFEDLVKNKPELLQGRKTNRKNEAGQELVEVFPFTTIDKELLAGSFTFDVNIVDSGPESEQRKRQDATILLQLSKENPLINKEEALKILFEAFGFNHLKERLLRSAEDVAKEQQAAMQQQIEAQKAVDEPKRTTDLQKTQMKSMVSLITTGMQADQKENEGRRKFVTEQAKTTSKERISSVDRLFELARSDNGGKK